MSTSSRIRKAMLLDLQSRDVRTRIGELTGSLLDHLWFKLILLAFAAVVLTCFDRKAVQLQNYGFQGNTYLSAELSTESSPTLSDFIKAMVKYRLLIKDAIELYRSRGFAMFAKVTNEDLNPVPSLEVALKYLADAPASKSQARNQIYSAAKELNTYVVKANKALSEREITCVPKGKPSDKIAINARLAINAFHSAVTVLERKRDFKSATAACLASREAGTRFQFAWSYLYSCTNYFALTTQFAKDLRLAQSITADLSQTIANPEQRSALTNYEHSLNRRHIALEGIVQENFEIVRRKLLEDSAKYRNSQRSVVESTK